MHHFLCGRLVLILIGIVGFLQLIHIILLNKLESRQHKNSHAPLPVFGLLSSSHADNHQVDDEVSTYAAFIERNWVLDASGEYQISLLQPYMRDLRGQAEDITLVTQCSQEHIGSLAHLINQWQGPLSVAVYARSGYEWSTLIELAKLHLSEQLIQTQAIFSFVWPVSAAGGLPPRPSNIPQSNISESNYNHLDAYPNNLLRNTARKTALTEFVFVIDVDMLPSQGLREDFLHLANHNGWFQKNLTIDKTVFVVPAFEGNVMPKNKLDLIHAFEVGKVRPFYSQLCWKCQAHTDYEMWLHQPVHQQLSPVYEVLWKDPWEPFYISLNSIPLYDERFKQYGFNRISQVCELHVAGFKFTVLNKAFVVHKGFKVKESFHLQKEEELEVNRKLFRLFKTELKTKYSESSRRCY